MKNLRGHSICFARSSGQLLGDRDVASGVHTHDQHATGVPTRGKQLHATPTCAMDGAV